jgi:hypothetical protein
LLRTFWERCNPANRWALHFVKLNRGEIGGQEVKIVVSTIAEDVKRK